MTNRAATMFGERTLVTPPDTTNRDGFPAYTRTGDDDLLQVLLTNTLGNTFYSKSEKLLDEGRAVIEAALARDPMFTLKAIVFARNEGFMRTMPLFALALASKAIKGPSTLSTAWETCFASVVRTPKDLADYTVIAKSITGGEGGRRTKRAAGNWLARRMSEYWVIKYGAEKEAGSYSLKDLAQVYHPRTGKPSALFDAIMGRPLKSEAVLAQLDAFERLKKATTDEEKVKAIADGRLPHEVATPFAGKSTKVWTEIALQMPIFALTRHLATLEERNVVNAIRPRLTSIFTDGERIRKSKMFPFRFSQAFDKVSTPWLRDLLRSAVDLSFGNVPEIPGTPVVMLDISGSMGPGYGHEEVLPQAALFAMILMKRTVDGYLFLFDTRADEFPFSRHDSLLTQAKSIGTRGGTDTASAVRMVMSRGLKSDTFILITDAQQNTGMPVYQAIEAYRRNTSRDLKTFIVNVAPEKGAIAPNNAPNTFWLYGWSDAAVRFISNATRGWGGLKAEVGKIDLMAEAKVAFQGETE